MSYTNAQVMSVLARIDERMAKLEKLVSAPVVSTVAATPARPLTSAIERTPTTRTRCSLHPDHKGGKGFTVNGLAAHRTWCSGEDVAI